MRGPSATVPPARSPHCPSEVYVDKNIDPKGGLAIGVIGHVPVGEEVPALGEVRGQRAHREI